LATIGINAILQSWPSRGLGSGSVAATAAGGVQRAGDRYRLDDLIRVVNGARVWRGTDEVLNRAVMIWVLQASEPVAAEVRAAVPPGCLIRGLRGSSMPTARSTSRT